MINEEIKLMETEKHNLRKIMKNGGGRVKVHQAGSGSSNKITKNVIDPEEIRCVYENSVLKRLKEENKLVLENYQKYQTQLSELKVI